MKNLQYFVLLVALATIAGCANRQETETVDLAIPVSIEDIRLQSIQQYVSTTGTARSTQEATLASEMTGIYRPVNNPSTGRPYKLGDRVRAGQVIVRLEDEEYVNNIAIESRKLNLEISEQEYEKQQSLYEKGGVTLRELRNAEVSATNARYEFENAQVRLSRMNIVAPFSGVIVDMPFYTPGTRIASGAQMVSLMSYDQMFMDINLPEKALSEVTVGQVVLITSYTISNDTLRGRVSELSPAISTETRTFKGKLTIDNPELLLRPGMFVKADIVVAEKENAIVVPKSIMLTSGRGRMVFVVDQSTATERRITIGIENQEYAEVISGLKENERLVVKGFETLRNNSKVKVIR